MLKIESQNIEGEIPPSPKKKKKKSRGFHGGKNSITWDTMGHQVVTTLLHASKNLVSKYVKQKLIRLKCKVDKSTSIMRDFNYPSFIKHLQNKTKKLHT